MYEEIETAGRTDRHVPWNKGKLTGQKRPFTLEQIWEIRYPAADRGPQA